MKAVNLIPWAGLHFSFAPGSLIDMPEDIAQARIYAGLMRLPTDEDLGSLPVFIFQANPGDPIPEISPEPEVQLEEIQRGRKGKR